MIMWMAASWSAVSKLCRKALPSRAIRCHGEWARAAMSERRCITLCPGRGSGRSSNQRNRPPGAFASLSNLLFSKDRLYVCCDGPSPTNRPTVRTANGWRNPNQYKNLEHLRQMHPDASPSPERADVSLRTARTLSGHLMSSIQPRPTCDCPGTRLLPDRHGKDTMML